MKILNSVLKLRFFLLVITILSFTSTLQGQCAGTDNTVDVCNKDADVANRDYDLFIPLIGETPGGTWSTTNPANFVALNQTTGILDLWRINNFGTHQFTYTNPACNESATVTINLGGYPGEDNIDGSANACSDDSAVNLDGYLGSETAGKVQDFNGVWEEDISTFSGQVNDNFFNAEEAGPGTYIFTYTVADVASCPSRVATLILEVHRSPEPGTASDFVRCTTDDFSTLTNVDLFSFLTDEDTNGTWSETSTNQLEDLNDSFINIEEINNTLGFGTYEFTYTVFPTHPVCQEQTSTVNIIILPVLNGTLASENYCAGEDYSVTLTYDDTLLPNGRYNLNYTLSSNSGPQSGEAEDVLLNGGTAQFNVDPALINFNELITLNITGAVGVSPEQEVCPSITVTETTFLISNANAAVTDICVMTDANVEISNVLDGTGNFANGLFDLEYTLTNPSSASSTVNLTEIEFTNGAASITIPASNLDEVGAYSISFSISNTFSTNCNLDTTFNTNPTPSTINLELIVDDSCDATQIDVVVDAPTLNDGSYTITYDVTELNSATILTTNTINFTGGTANYQIDVDALPDGNYIASVRSIQDDSTDCRLVFEFEEIENFSRGGAPEPPVGDANQNFCLSDYPSGPTLADIEFTATGDIMFYTSAAGPDTLPITTQLVDGTDYFISNTDTLNNCENTDRLQVTVALTDTPEAIQLELQVDDNCQATQIDVIVNAPVLNDGQYTITYEVIELGETTAITTNTVTIPGGAMNYQIDASTLANGNYTAIVRSVQDDTTPCRSLFEFEETLNFSRGGVPEPPQVSDQTFCLSDYPTTGPTLLDINVTATGDILFYATATDMDILSINTPLVEGEDYFISNIDPLNNCEGSARVQMTVSFSDPEGPMAMNSNPLFCIENNPTLNDIEVTLPSGSTVVWFDSSTGGTVLAESTTLIDGQTYYAAANDGTCTSTTRVEIVPTVETVPATSLVEDTIILCGLDNPTVLELNVLENEIDYDVYWFTTETGGTALSVDTILELDTIYYAENVNPETGCVSTQRVPVNVDLSNCEPENYDFFIPDGFSPNADGRNDTYFIPNLALIFPDFTLEIINRYGTTIFKGDRNNPAWDGSNGSSMAPNGVYFYIINYNKNNSEPIQGRLYLNR